MEAQTLTIEAFQEQWKLLTDTQKKLLFSIALNFNEKTEEASIQTQVPDEHWKRIYEEREAHLNGSKNYSWDEVKDMARNKEKRHGLSSRD